MTHWKRRWNPLKPNNHNDNDSAITAAKKSNVSNASLEADTASVRQKKLGGMLGLAKKAGKLVFGTEKVTECVRAKKAKAVFYASDISENTGKRIFNCCVYYNTEVIMLDMTMHELSGYLGSPSLCSAAAVTDHGFTQALLRLCKKSASHNERN